jgi:hypothetical protein
MKNFTLTMLAVTCTLFTYSQIAQGGEPLNWKQKTTNSEINFVKTNVLDMAIIDAEDAVVDQYKETPFRYGITQVVDFDFFFNASSKTLSNGDKIWSMGIDCPNAKSVNLIFGEYFLPEDAKVYIYSEDRTEYIGAFTSANNKEYGSLAVGLVHSNRVIIEFHEPATVAGQALLNISEITHGYRAVVNKFEVDKGPFGNSGSCNMNTNCPDAGPWQDEKRGVALILNSGSAWCTGSLVNNTNEDETPYFLTAAHCDGNENNWVMYFNHEYLGCANSGSAATNQSISGGTQLASTSPSDAHLVELSSNVPASYNPYFNGWDRSGVAVSTAVGIHHPAGDVKKISFDDDPLQKTSYLSGTVSPTGNHWRVELWERNTTTEGGSSGSPLFDQNHRIVGQLHGGFASCSSDTDDWYGAMHASWATLDGFLAPGSPGTTVLDGFDPAATGGSVDFDLKVFLQGPYESGSSDMNDLLRQSGNIPLSEPYTAIGFTHVNGGGESTTNTVLNVTGNNAIVDWIFVEIRSGVTPTTVLATQSALLQRDGDIVDVDGVSPVSFATLPESSVYVALRHRNHFGIRTNATSSTGSLITIDFNDPAVGLFGTNGMITVGGNRTMIAADANGDGQINSIDKNSHWRVQNGAAFIYLTSTGDFDLNGTVNSIDKNILWRVNNSLIQQLD